MVLLEPLKYISVPPSSFGLILKFTPNFKQIVIIRSLVRFFVNRSSQYLIFVLFFAGREKLKIES